MTRKHISFKGTEFKVDKTVAAYCLPREAEAGGLLWVQGNPEAWSESEASLSYMVRSGSHKQANKERRTTTKQVGNKSANLLVPKYQQFVVLGGPEKDVFSLADTGKHATMYFTTVPWPLGKSSFFKS